MHVYSVDTKGALLGRAARIKCGISLTIEQEKQQKDEEAKRSHEIAIARATHSSSAAPAGPSPDILSGSKVKFSTVINQSNDSEFVVLGGAEIRKA